MSIPTITGKDMQACLAEMTPESQEAILALAEQVEKNFKRHAGYRRTVSFGKVAALELIGAVVRYQAARKCRCGEMLRRVGGKHWKCPICG